MRAKTIIELTEFVLGPGFTVAATETMFGPRAERRLGHAVSLVPRDPLYGTVEIELLHEREPVGLRVQLSRLVSFSLDPLVELFGPAEERPRSKPHDPIPWRFRMPDGWLTVLSSCDEVGGPHQLAGVVIRRRGVARAPSARSSEQSEPGAGS